MGYGEHWSQLSSRRKVALLAGIPLWLVSATWGLLLFLRTVPAPMPPPVHIALFVAAGAGGAAIVVIEMVRSVVPRYGSWSDKLHFRLVGLLFAVFFAMQYTGIRIAFESASG